MAYQRGVSVFDSDNLRIIIALISIKRNERTRDAANVAI